MKLFIILLTLLCGASPLFAQPDVDLIRFYDGGNTHDLFTDVYHAANGDYLVCGYSNYHGWVMRLDSEGQVVWSYLDRDQRQFNSIIEADNGDIVTVGEVGGFRALRLDRDGQLVWRKSYGGVHARAVIELKQGDFLICGNASQGAVGCGYVIRIDADGNRVWERNYADSTFFSSMRETEDGVILCGDIGVYSHRGWIESIDFNGNEVWSHIYFERFENGITRLSFTSIISTPDGFALCATLTLDGNGFGIYFIDDQGEVTRSRIINEASGAPYCLARMSDGGLIVVGVGNGGYPLGVRLDRNDVFIWTKDFHEFYNGAPGNANVLLSVIVLPGDVIVAAGQMINTEVARQGDDGVMVRLSPDPMYPMIFYKQPEDSLQTLLRGDSLQFILRARDRLGREFTYNWFYEDSLISQDTTKTVVFDMLFGDYSIMCHISNEYGEVRTGWMVRVRDLFIAAYAPDTLSLALRRGSIVNFSIDSVAATQGEPVNYAWTLRDLGGGQQEDLGVDTFATVEFRRSGDYSLEGYVFRGASDAAVTWNISVRSLVFDFRPEQQTLTVPLDTTITFGIIPFDPADTTITYRWYLDGDSVGADSSDSVQFSAWDGLEAHPTRQVTAIVSDSSDADTIVWNVTVVRPDGVGAHCNSPLPAFSFQLSPNPFNARSSVHFSLPAASPIQLTLYDLNGRAVRSLATGRFSTGEHQIALDAAELPAGLYFLRLEAAGIVKIAKAVVMK